MKLIITWKVIKQLSIPEEFESFRYNDRNRDKEESSKIMWAIALLLDPDSKFKGLDYRIERHW